MWRALHKKDTLNQESRGANGVEGLVLPGSASSICTQPLLCALLEVLALCSCFASHIQVLVHPEGAVRSKERKTKWSTRCTSKPLGICTPYLWSSPSLLNYVWSEEIASSGHHIYIQFWGHFIFYNIKLVKWNPQTLSYLLISDWLSFFSVTKCELVLVLL